MVVPATSASRVPDHDRRLQLQLGAHEDGPGPQVGIDRLAHQVLDPVRSWGSAAAVRTAIRLVTVSATTPVALEWWSSNSWEAARTSRSRRSDDHDEQRRP